MSSIFGLGTSGIFAAQRQLQTIGHNITNSTTEGYSRQITELRTREPTNLGAEIVGTGVKVTGTNRVVDEILISLNRDNISEAEEFDTFLDIANRINIILSDSDTGVSEGINNFYDAVQTLTADPSSSPARQVVIDSAKTLESRILSLDQQIDDQIFDINNQISEIVTQINGIVSSIVKLNQDIATSGNLSANSQPNDLLDQRDKLLNDLAKLVDVGTIDKPDGGVDVFIGDGQSVLVGNASLTLVSQRDSTDPTVVDVALKTSATTNSVITANMTGGKLGGLLGARAEVLDKTQNAMGRVAITLSSTFNDQHQLGIDLNGALGQRFFKDVNDTALTLSRSIADTLNVGTGKLAVTIDTIPRPDSGPYKVLGVGSSLVDVATLASIDNVGELTIGGTNIQNASAGDDTVSTVDNASSAIATAAAINKSNIAGVSAKAEINQLYLGTFTPGVFTAGQFQINGVNIAGGADETTLLQNINALSPSTGVRAEGDGSLNITLIAEDGRNIQLTSNTDTPVATFQHFDTNSATALDQVQRAGVSITSTTNPIVLAGTNPGDVGFTAGSTPAAYTSLTTSDYALNYDGTNYTLIRESDSAVVSIVSAANFAASGMNVDGFTIRINSGNIVAGDRYKIRPTRNGGGDFALRITDLENIAVGMPVMTEATVKAGTGIITVDEITNTTGNPTPTANKLGNAFGSPKSLTPPLRIEFFNDSSGSPVKYRVYDITNGSPGTQIGPEQTYVQGQSNSIFPITGVINKTSPGPNAPYTYDPGYRVSITGTPEAGDQFEIRYNTDGRADGRNGVQLSKMQGEKLIASQSSTIQEAFSEAVATVGATTARTESSLIASESLLKQSEDLLLSISGVNLDEEASKLLQYQQLYRASAQLIIVGREIFESLIGAFR